MYSSLIKTQRNIFVRGFGLFIICFLASSLSNVVYGNDKTDSNPVEHKNSQLDVYLDLIRYDCREKIGILPYILKKSKGVYLEIGTGGDPIAEMLEEIPSTANVEIIAADIDEDILKSLPIRNPELQKYIAAKNGPKLQLQKLNAVDMSVFENNFLDGINASALVHEIFSYEGGFEGIEKLFKEAFRTLKNGGILVYRDPEGVSNKKSIVSVTLKNKTIKLFFSVFIYKFLNKKCGFLNRTGRKVQVYTPDEITFRIYKKHELTNVKLTYDQYLEVPSAEIDFYRDYKVTLPLGLYHEFARHYLTYLHECNPLSFIKFTPDISSGLYNVSYLAHDKLNNFSGKDGRLILDERINGEQISKIEEEIDKCAKVLEFGIPLKFTSKRKKGQLRSLLQKHGFASKNYIIPLEDGSLLLDYRIFGILYDEIKEQIFDSNNGPLCAKDEAHAEWLKREGEEFYFYYSDDELISRVAQITTEKYGEETFVLCPLSENHNTFIHRICYTEILSSLLDVRDSFGYPIDVKDGKRVIHFCKKPLSEALDVYKKIIDSDPIKYSNLREIVINLEAKAY
jgi:SAM-dependent methyltransferase